jgi:hypothetical protein
VLLLVSSGKSQRLYSVVVLVLMTKLLHAKCLMKVNVHSFQVVVGTHLSSEFVSSDSKDARHLVEVYSTVINVLRSCYEIYILSVKGKQLKYDTESLLLKWKVGL